MAVVRYWLKKIRDNPLLNLLAASILLISVLLETTDSLIERALGFEIKAYHGLLVFSAFHVLKYIPDLLEAIDFAIQGRK